MPLTLYRKIKLGLLPVNNRAPVEHRFWKNVNKEGPVHPVHGPCWQWEGRKDTGGYGEMMIKRGRWKAHRYSYVLLVGEIPADRLVLHKCDNTSCVNPSHLFLGDHVDNQKDKTDKNRQARGETIVASKLTTEQVLEIRKRYKKRSRDNLKSLAKEFGVTAGAIWFIVNRKHWRHL
jgi:hypothetical protein